MTKKVIQTFLLSAFIILIPNQWAIAQCNRDALAAKYWQYRNTFNKHFILTDRREGDCVGDGIYYVSGIHPAAVDSTTIEHCGHRFLNGYSLPATSINLEPSGAFYGMSDRNKILDDGTTPSIFYDPDCANTGPSHGTHWEFSQVHNYLEMGEETPHQM